MLANEEQVRKAAAQEPATTPVAHSSRWVTKRKVAVQNPRGFHSLQSTFGLPALHPRPARVPAPPALGGNQNGCRPRCLQRLRRSPERSRCRRRSGARIRIRSPSASSPPQSWLTRAGRADRIFCFLLVPPAGRTGHMPAANRPNHKDASPFPSPPSHFPLSRALPGTRQLPGQRHGAPDAGKVPTNTNRLHSDAFLRSGRGNVVTANTMPGHDAACRFSAQG